MAMTKTQAMKLLGGNATTVAARIGITPSAVSQWPEQLPARVEDRVLAALARELLPKHLLETDQNQPREVLDAA